MKSNPNIDFENDWKLLTLLIGANDACPLCNFKNDSHITPEQAAEIYSTNIENTLVYIQSTIPKILVNIMPIFNISQVYNISLNSTYCDIFHTVLPACFCAFDSDYEKRSAI